MPAAPPFRQAQGPEPIAGQYAHVSISPDMTIEVEGYGDMTEDVARELAQIRHAEEQELAHGAALARQLAIAKETGAEAGRFGPHARLAGQVDARIFAYWQRRYGDEFWTDKANRAEFFKKHPECAVKYLPKIFGLRAPLLGGKATTKDDRLTLKSPAVPLPIRQAQGPGFVPSLAPAAVSTGSRPRACRGASPAEPVAALGGAN